MGLIMNFETMTRITVEHDVSPDENNCTYGGDFYGKYVCKYHRRRNRTHGKKAPTEYHVPKCTLFNVWLKEDYVKCEECRDACSDGRQVSVAH